MAAVAMPTSPVPLDTIPVSPAGGNGDLKHESGDIVTVFHDPNNFNVKHPLAHTWTLWFTKPPSGKGDNNWNDLLKEVISFDSVEEFWGIYVSLLILSLHNVATNHSLEQHHTNVRASGQSRLPSLQARCAS